MDVHPTKNVSIGIDPYPYELTTFAPVLPVLKGVSLRPLLSLTQNLPGQLDTPQFQCGKRWETMGKQLKRGMLLFQHLFLCCLLCAIFVFELLWLFNVCSLCFFSCGGFGAILMLKRCVDDWIGWCFLCGHTSFWLPLQFPIQSHQYLVGGFNHLETY